MLENQVDDQWIERIVQSLKEIEYGSVEIVIHHSKIKQVDRMNKQRFPLENQQLVLSKQAKES